MTVARRAKCVAKLHLGSHVSESYLEYSFLNYSMCSWGVRYYTSSGEETGL